MQSLILTIKPHFLLNPFYPLPYSFSRNTSFEIFAAPSTRLEDSAIVLLETHPII